MRPYFRVRLFKRTLIALMKFVGFVLFVIYIVLPLAYRFTPALQRHLVFLPYLRWPWGVNFSEPSTQGMVATRNFYLETEPGIKVGVWHSLPKSLADEPPSEEWEFETKLSSGRPIIVYFHGNSGSRAGPHRVELYKILQSLDYHVITFDYRGYADSSQVVMSENGVVADAKAVYHYVKKFAKDVAVYVWGHSLGTGVASRAVAELCLGNQQPNGLILESPFNNILDEVRSHPLSYIFRPFPAFDWFFTSPLTANNLAFQSDQHIGHVDCGILILHAHDDAVVPFHLGKKLYSVALETRSSRWPSVRFVEFEESRGYAHKYICRAPELPGLIREFIEPADKLKMD